VAAPVGDFSVLPEADVFIDGLQIDRLQLGRLGEARRFVVVSTQGKGDEAALKAALSIEAEYRAFVGSRRKMASLRQKLTSQGVEAAVLDRVKAPAGLDLGAITPEEIALSILAEITIERRRGQRGETNEQHAVGKGV
jgi:xanthine dehydrogenase accessory factor